MVNERDFDNAWKTLEGNTCPQHQCPDFKVELRFESETPYTPCFNPPPDEVGSILKIETF